MTDIDIIRDNVHELERLAQLAEEAAELAQAALKLRRVYKRTGNPTPVTLQGAYQNLLEELADVARGPTRGRKASTMGREARKEW